MKKLLLVFAFIAMSVWDAYAQSLSDYVGTYTGTLYNIEMNGKTGYSSRTMSFQITNDGYLKGEIGAIGSMPGVININLAVSVENGRLVAQSETAGTLTFNIGGSTTLYVDDDEGGLVGEINSSKTMSFTLNVVGSMLGISVFPASVSFVSTSFVAGI